MEYRVAVVLVLVLTLHGALSQVVLPYDCRTSPCVNDNCNGATPTQCEGATAATCTSTFNFDCGSSAAQDTSIATNCPACNVAGTWNCADTGTAPCTCNQGFYSSTANNDCSLERIRAVCQNGGIDMYVNPYEGAGFTGSVYMLTDSLSAATPGSRAPLCLFSTDTTTDAPETIQAMTAYPYTTAGTVDATCPTAVAGTNANSQTTYTLYFYVQFTPLYSDADLEVSVTCTQPVEGNIETADVTVVGVNPQLTPLDVVTDIVSGASFGIYSVGDLTTNLAATFTNPSAATPLTAGTEVDFVFSLTKGLIYDDLGVVSLIAYNYNPDSAAPSDAVTFTIMDDGCVPIAVGRFVTKVTKALDANDNNIIRIIITVKAFTMPLPAGSTDPAGTVYFRATMCPTAVGATACPPPNRGTNACGATSVTASNYVDNMLTVAVAARRRRRRQAENQSPAEHEYRPLDVALFVRDPTVFTGLNTNVGSNNDDNESCYQSLAFLLPIILLSIILVAAIVMAMYFCMKVSRSHNNHVEGNTNMAYK